MTRGSHPDEDEPSKASDFRGDGDIVHDDDAAPLVHTVAQHLGQVSREAFEANRICLRAEERFAFPIGRRTEPPTEEEARETHAWLLDRHQRLLNQWAVFDAWRRDLADRRDPLTLAVLGLHSMSEGDHGPVCDGCPPDNEWGPPSWPCDTVAVVAEHHGVQPVPAAPDGSRPDPDDPPRYQDPADWTPPPSFADLFTVPTNTEEPNP